MQQSFDLLTDTYENPDYLSDQLLTYLGNKRALLKPIDAAVQLVREKMDWRKLRTADVFSGSGVVTRLLKQHSDYVIANDFESYATCISRAYLTNDETVDWLRLNERISQLNRKVDFGDCPTGFIAEMYAPQSDEDIKPGERVFYTAENARRIDGYAQLIRSEADDLQDILMASLLSSASIHANTGGVFKGFYKDRETGLGRFGGSGEHALSRIKSPVRLKAPVLSNFSARSSVFQLDAARLPEVMEPVDLVYLDPPYNQHPYGSNYFMLNLILDYQRPAEVSRVSGIPVAWQRSDYNVRTSALIALSHLVSELPTRFVLLSFSDDGFLDPNDLMSLFSNLGKCQVFNNDYNTYRASRNLSGRSLTVTEHLFLLEKS